MRALLSCFCWTGRISRRSWLAHSLVATAFLLLGVCLSFWYVTSYALGDPLFALADTVLACSAFMAFCTSPAATLGMLVLMGFEVTGSFGNGVAQLAAAGAGTWGLLCGLLTLLLLLASALRLLALAIRRRRDAGKPFWPLLLFGGVIAPVMAFLLPHWVSIWLVPGIQLWALLQPTCRPNAPDGHSSNNEDRVPPPESHC